MVSIVSKTTNSFKQIQTINSQKLQDELLWRIMSASAGRNVVPCRFWWTMTSWHSRHALQTVGLEIDFNMHQLHAQVGWHNSHPKNSRSPPSKQHPVTLRACLRQMCLLSPPWFAEFLHWGRPPEQKNLQRTQLWEIHSDFLWVRIKQDSGNLRSWKLFHEDSKSGSEKDLLSNQEHLQHKNITSWP